MKKISIMLITTVITSISFAQYTSKYDAVNGIESVKPVNLKFNNQTNRTNTFYFSNDFDYVDSETETEILEGWSKIDWDGDGEQWSWDASTFDPDGNGACESSSWSGEALTPDNWLITPVINLGDAEGNVTLGYEIGAMDVNWEAEHYGVYISTTGIEVADFTLLFEETVPEHDFETPQWNNRTVDLSAYAGEVVYIAFRHFNCSDLYIMMLDDVEVYENTTIDASLTGVVSPSNESSCTLTNEETIIVNVFNNGGVDITAFDLSYSINGAAAVTETVSASIAPSTTFAYSFTTTADFSALGYYSIDFTILLTDDSNSENDNYTYEVANTDGVISVSVTTTIQGDQSVYIYNSNNEEVWYHPAYPWNITTTDNVCVLDDDCYSLDFQAPDDHSLVVAYNTDTVANITLTTGTVFGIGGNCPEIDAFLYSVNISDTISMGLTNVKGKLLNIGSAPITSFDAVYSIDGGPTSEVYSVTDVNLATNTDYDFTHDVQWNAIAGTHNVEIAISNVNEDEDEAIANNVLSKNIYVLDLTGVNNVVNNNISIYPNPSTGKVFVSNISKANIAVYNVIGEVIKSIKNADGTTVVDLTDQQNGTYIIKIQENQSIVTKKIIINK
jgi:hypothetical protein